MGGTRDTYGERRNTYRVLVGKPEGKRQRCGFRSIVGYNIKIHPEERIGQRGQD
jgi:hypothetical protein